MPSRRSSRLRLRKDGVVPLGVNLQPTAACQWCPLHVPAFHVPAREGEGSRDQGVPVGGDLKRVSSRVAIRVSADMMPRGHLGPRRGEGKHRIGCWAWEASVATGSCPFAGDTPGKVERAPAAATPAEVGLAQPERRSCGGFEWSRVNSWRGRASERGREQSRSRCTGMLSRRCSVFVRIWLRRKIVQWRFQVPEAKQFGGDQVWATRHGCQRGPTGVRNARRSQPAPESRHHLTIVQVRSTARGGLQSGHPSLSADWRRLPRQTPSQIVTRLGRLAFHDNRQNGHHDARLWPRNRHTKLLSLGCIDRRPFDEARQINQVQLTVMF